LIINISSGREAEITGGIFLSDKNGKSKRVLIHIGSRVRGELAAG
jgi:hypothetical protein